MDSFVQMPMHEYEKLQKEIGKLSKENQRLRNFKIEDLAKSERKATKRLRESLDEHVKKLLEICRREDTTHVMICTSHYAAYDRADAVTEIIDLGEHIDEINAKKVVALTKENAELKRKLDLLRWLPWNKREN